MYGRRALLISAILLSSALAPAATQRKINGIITAVEPSTLSIQPNGKKSVSGRLDPTRTKIVVDGHLATAAALQITYDAKAELGLDDVWVSVRAESQ